MFKIGSKKLKTFGIVLLIIFVLIAQSGLLEKDIRPYLNTGMWVTFALAVLAIFIFIFGKIRNHNLLRTVTKSNRGTKSERNLVLKLLKHGIPAQNIFHDLYLEKSNGGYAQIDLVVLTQAGVIVFEVKDFSGWIFGNGNYSQWTKVLAYGKNKYRFYNPIMQNRQHVQNLRRKLKQLENVPFYSIVVFYGDCVLKEVSFVPKGTYLVKPKRVQKVMRIIAKENDPVNYPDYNATVRMLKKAVLNGENAAIQNQHIENVKDLLGKDRIYD